MDVLALRLSFANDGNLPVDDIARRQRMARDEQDENVAGPRPDRDLPLPIGPAGHKAVKPDLNRAVLDGGPEIAGHERQPFDLVRGGLLRLVGVGVADEDDRLIGLGRHDP